MTFDGFISYSHAADGRLAPAVQRGLHRLAKPWHRRRALWIFRDQTGLAVTPGLWSSIQTALDGSQYFVLLASPEAARSPWVNREIEHWIATKSANRILPVVTDGEWAWDGEAGDFTEGSTAVPPALREVFTEEPFFLDLRWARGSEQLSLHHSRFRDAIAQLAAPMHGVSKDELEGEDVRQHRRAKRLRSGAVVTLVVLALVTSLTGLSAVRNGARAKDAAAEAMRQQHVADTQRDSAERSAAEARRQQALATQQQDLARQQQARASQAAAVADESERVADTQQRLADQATAEAKRQRSLADQAAARTAEQQRLTREEQARAKEQQRLAEEAAARAKRLQQEARRLELVAAEQRRLADEAAAEARQQQAKADQQERIAVSRRLMTQSMAAIGEDPKTALMLGAAAQSINPDAVNRRQLAGAVTSTHYTGSIPEVGLAVFAPDGVLMALGNDGHVSLWKAPDPRYPVRIATLPETAAADGLLQLSGDGRTLAVLGADRKAVLWDVTDRSHPVRLYTLPDVGRVTALAFVRDGTLAVTGEDHGRMTLWDTTGRTEPVKLAQLSGNDSYGVQHLALSSRGLLIADKGLYVPVIDLSDRTNPVPLHGFLQAGYAPMAFSPDGLTLAVGEREGTVTLWNMNRKNSHDEDPLDPSATPGSPPPTFGPPTMPDFPPDPDDPDFIIPPASPPATTTTPSPTPTTPATPTSTRGAPTTDPFDTLTGPTGAVTSIVFSSDGNLLLAGDENGAATTWDRSTGASAGAVGAVRTHGPVRSLSVNPKNGTFVTADGSATATLWTVTGPGTPDPVGKLPAQGDGLRGTVFRPNGRTLLVTGTDALVSTWNVKDPSHATRGDDMIIADTSIRTAAYSADRRTVAAVTTAGVLTLADATQPGRAKKLADMPGYVVGDALAFSPDGRTLAVVLDENTLLLWDVSNRTRPVLRSRFGGALFGTSLAFSPDGRTLATASYDGPMVTLWNVANPSAPARLASFVGDSKLVNALAFSADSHTLAVGGWDAMAVLWDVSDPSHPARTTTLNGNSRWVQTLSFSADGHTLAVGDGDYSVTLWDTASPATPIRLATMKAGLTSHPREVSFGPDGRTVAVTGLRDVLLSTVTLWDAGELAGIRSDPAKYACAIVGRGLTPAEWARYVPELKYRRSCPS
jgi:WD40 repeat protein